MSFGPDWTPVVIWHSITTRYILLSYDGEIIYIEAERTDVDGKLYYYPGVYLYHIITCIPAYYR